MSLPPGPEPRFEYLDHMIAQINWCEADAGMVRLRPGFPVYLDGSAEAVGTPWGCCAGALVQPGPGGTAVAVAQHAGPDVPPSAAAGENLAVGLLLRLAARGTANGTPFQPGDLPVFTDCLSVQIVAEGHRAVRPSYPYAGFWREAARPVIGPFQKVAAHQSRERAEAEGWLDHWRGNDAADDLAKSALPRSGAARGGFARALRQVCGALRGAAAEWAASAWAAASRFRRPPGAGRVAVRLGPSRPRHTVIQVHGVWVCSVCGRTGRRRTPTPQGSESLPGQPIGWCRLTAGSHGGPSHPRAAGGMVLPAAPRRDPVYLLQKVWVLLGVAAV